MQIQLPVNVTEEKQIVRLIGFLEKQCLLITLPANLNWQKPVREGDKVIARVFLGRGAFGFTSHISKVIRSPFDYLHLTWPTEFQGLLIRKAPRVKTELAAKVQTASGSVETQVVNLSATGMMLRSTAALGAKGEELAVTLPLALYDVTTELALRGTIKLVNTSKDEAGEFHLSGVEFVNLQPNETLILQSVVHHELGRNPYSVV
ncbi:MAG: flagellar brake protein [Betaproteobacteria bacterium]